MAVRLTSRSAQTTRRAGEAACGVCRSSRARRPSRPSAPGLRTLASGSSTSKTWYEEKYERNFQRKKRERVYTGRKDDDSIKVQRVQWYPGHIAKAERLLKERLKAVDVILELRDARIAFSTEHPDLDSWAGNKPKILVLNRVDMVSKYEFRRLEGHFNSLGVEVVGTNGKTGQGVPKLVRRAVSVSSAVNEKRASKGLLPREVRAAVVGFPNVGKSAIINRLMKRKACESANIPGVTRQLRWIKAGDELYVLDAPGVLPSSLEDQTAAQNLAICNDIGKASYLESAIAGVLVERVRGLPKSEEILRTMEDRYKISPKGVTGEEYVYMLADRLFNGHIETAGARMLRDYGKGNLGKFALELPPK
ncbi:GTP-binding ribosome biogenesis protein YlqF [Chloropicon roscoffensis]|uniref:GTP-binding ribosome biogenesis protein YlqF n=1 Tax=Chloropicon roscoffensis TaxID=1461544 RepID=A0AAX4P5T5_9CHLO